MSDKIDELSRVIGSIESKVDILFHKYDSLCKEMQVLNKNFQNRKLQDSAKAFIGGIIGGFAAVIAKMGIWKYPAGCGRWLGWCGVLRVAVA